MLLCLWYGPRVRNKIKYHNSMKWMFFSLRQNTFAKPKYIFGLEFRSRTFRSRTFGQKSWFRTLNQVSMWKVKPRSLFAGCGVGEPAILDDWSRSQKLLDGEAWAWNLGSSSQSFVRQANCRKYTENIQWFSVFNAPNAPNPEPKIFRCWSWSQKLCMLGAGA